ncbi:MAG: diacylglycerol kinase [Candidatus Calescibacterium sp.]|nr:diacylglycerol kinase [Candidatus Calescibacterium sp.]MCX7971915.1 diacylglycerol kinase [bacterium]MDW8194986.1 diacylglycerol kinase [Candidatus Calescibacterium sp.]
MSKKFRRNKFSSSILESFSNAVNGIFEAFYQERNLRIHLIVALFVILASLLLSLTAFELLIILIVVGVVFISELFNTAIEILADKLEPNKDEQIKLIKDISASAVLVSTILAILAALVIFPKKIFSTTPLLIQKISSLPEYVYILVFMIVLILSMGIKVWYMRLKGRNTNVQGGIISVHSALAFSTFTFIVIHNWQDYVSWFMSLVLALLVAQSRLEAKIHTLSEVVNGAIFGIIVTYLLIQVINFLGGT